MRRYNLQDFIHLRSIKVDQAALAHQDLLRYNPQCCLHVDMDSHLCLLAAYHREEAIWIEAKSSYNLKLYRTNPLQEKWHPGLL